LPTAVFEGHLDRHDFSRWIADVFGDYLLAKTVKQIEDDYHSHAMPDVASRLVQAIRTRYEVGGQVLS
jgi:hypothetical protein